MSRRNRNSNMPEPVAPAKKKYDAKAAAANMDGTAKMLMYMMPLSVAATIALVSAAAAGDMLPLLPTVGGIAAFYAVWALRNYFVVGRKQERGMFTMGTISLGAIVDASSESNAFAGHVIAVVGCVAVVFSFALVASRIAKWPISKIAHVAGGKSLTWAKIYKGYMLSSVLVWTAILILVARAIPPSS